MKFNIAKYKEENYPFLNKLDNLCIARYKELPDLDIDWDVYLPSFGINLQRGFVWSLEQKEDFILSVFKGIHIHPVSVIIDDTLPQNKYLIIDGKQRINTIIRFLQNNFGVRINGNFYYYDDLDKESQRYINGKNLSSFAMYSNDKFDPMNDIQKIQWFTYINFRGTEQDNKHKEKLLELLK